MKTWNSRIAASLASLFLVLLSFCAFAPSVSGQGRVNQYQVTTPTLTWNDLQNTGGNWLYSDVWKYYNGALTTSLPFKFVYDNTTFAQGTTIFIQDASIGLGSNSSYGDNNGGLGMSAYVARLYPWGANYVAMGDNSTNAGQTPSYGILEQTTGTAPNQVYTIQMTGVHTCWGSMWSGTSCISSMQVKFYQATGVIQFLYQSHNNYMAGSYTAEVGLNGTSSPSFQYLTAESASWYTPSTDLQFTPPAPPAELSLQPKLLSFGGVGTGSTLTLYDTVYSVGAVNLKINTATVTGSTNFSLVSGPANGTVLAPGTSAVYGIQFAPTGNGTLTGTFTVNSTGADSAVQSCLLNGTGLAPSVAYTFPYNGLYPNNTLFHHIARRFGDTAVQYLYIQNTGKVQMVINSIYFVGLQSSMYSLIHVPSSPMAAGVLDSIGVKFRPYLEGRPDAQLIISTNAYNQPTDTVSMWGVGILGHLVVTPSRGTGNTLAFDSVAIGDSLCESITLHNTGSDTVKITKQVVTYGDYDYTFYPLKGTDLTLPPDASKLVNVCFVPVARGDRFASIRFYTNISPTYPDNRDTSQFPVNVTGTGVPYGILSMATPAPIAALIDSTTCISSTIKNVGLSDLTVNTATITGAGASDFTLSPPAPFTIGAGQSKPVTICYTASSRGPEAVSLVLTGVTSGRPLSQAVALNGLGQEACLDAAPSPIAFGSTALPGKTLAKTGHDTTCITVTNCGDVPVTYSAAFTPGTSGAYTVLGAIVTPVVLPNGTTTICIEFDPDAIGPANGSVVVSASEKAALPKTLSLSGIGGGVIVSGDGEAGNVGVTQCDTITVTINNTGNVDWTPGTGITTVGTNASDFTPIGTTNPATIPAGGSGTIRVAFCPTTSGLAETATLTFPNAAPAPFSGNVTLGGLGSSAGVAQRTEQDGFSIGASYPNPTNGKADIIVTVPQDSKVTIALTNLAGEVVRTVYNGTLPTGNNTVSLDAQGLASGTYFYMLTSGTVQLTREMVIVK